MINVTLDTGKYVAGLPYGISGTNKCIIDETHFHFFWANKEIGRIRRDSIDRIYTEPSKKKDEFLLTFNWINAKGIPQTTVFHKIGFGAQQTMIDACNTISTYIKEKKTLTTEEQDAERVSEIGFKKVKDKTDKQGRILGGILLLCLLSLIGWCSVSIVNKNSSRAVVEAADDGSVRQVEYYLASTMNDPKSYEAIDWSPVKFVDATDQYVVRHKYRARNAFGALIIVNEMFYLDKEGKIVNVRRLSP